MKVFFGFILLNVVLTGPTPPPYPECPTECEEVRKIELYKGARPRYRYCDIEELYEKCQNVSKPDEVNFQLFHASATRYISFKSTAGVIKLLENV